MSTLCSNVVSFVRDGEIYLRILLFATMIIVRLIGGLFGIANSGTNLALSSPPLSPLLLSLLLIYILSSYVLTPRFPKLSRLTLNTIAPMLLATSVLPHVRSLTVETDTMGRHPVQLWREYAPQLRKLQKLKLMNFYHHKDELAIVESRFMDLFPQVG